MQVQQPFLMFSMSLFIETVMVVLHSIAPNQAIELNTGENVELEKVMKVTKKKSAGRQITSLQVSCFGSVIQSMCFSPPHKKHLLNLFCLAVFKR
jgi:hypothetical protein